jgi:hypothetical protein
MTIPPSRVDIVALSTTSVVASEIGPGFSPDISAIKNVAL